MIATGFETRIKVQEIVENQLPSFVVSESPKSVDFLNQYYISQEYQGGPIDIAENLDQYIKLDNLTPEVLSGKTLLSSTIDSTETTINVESTKGYPQQYGLFQINNEIITYTGITTNSFTGCIRGFSGVTEYDMYGELVFSTSESNSHQSGSTVTNLSSLFLKEFYKKIKFLLTPGLENLNFVPELDVNNFIKQAKNFYQAKGTEESFRILFNILYNVNPKVIDLERFVIKPSSAEFQRREIIVIDVISGNPEKLVGQIITKESDLNTKASVSEVEIIREGQRQYFKLSLFIGYTDETDIRGNFTITPINRVVENVSIGSSIITVDSTVGFSKTGTLVCSGNIINYSEKTINQFLGCVGITSSISTKSEIRANDLYYGYENGDITKKVVFRITGVLSEYLPITDTSLSTEGEKIYVSNLGEIIQNPPENKNFKQVFANSWIYNTSVRYKVESIDGSTFKLYSQTDKSSLNVNDNVDILNRGTEDIAYSNATVVGISSAIYVSLDTPGFTPINGYSYDIRRKLKKANSFSDPSLFGQKFGNNTLIADTLNVYNENNQYFYVASNSLPSYPLTVSFASTSIPTALVQNSSIQGLDSFTNKYTILSFGQNVPFITGDAVYYSPEFDNISGIDTGVYYVQVLEEKNKIKLYETKSFIATGESVQFEEPDGINGNHIFTLFSQKGRFIGPQKLLKKFPNTSNISPTFEVETFGNRSIGMLCNGVEIVNYKSEDRVYYGPIKEINILNGGYGYDLVNPPKIEISNPSIGNTAYAEPILRGNLEEILVDPQDFDIGEVLSVDITGGNGKGYLLEPVVETKFREVFFDARERFYGGGIDIDDDTITFQNNHNFRNGETIVYNNNSNPSIGIGKYQESNSNTLGLLQSNGLYYTKVLNTKTIKIYEKFEDYISGINTVGFTTVNTGGTHKFITYTGKSTLSRINIVNSGDGFEYKNLIVKPENVNKEFSYIKFKDHGFKTGEIIEYSHTKNRISGLTTSSSYYVLNIDDDRFRLCDAGIGATSITNFNRKNFVKFKSVGTGYHSFRYPKIKIDIKVSNQVGVITATPYIRGSIVGTYLYEPGSGYGSNILNLQKKPLIKVLNGKNALVTPIISNGTIIGAAVQGRGSGYYSIPDVIVEGDGTGAKLKAEIDENYRLKKILVIQGGSGYSKEATRIKIKSAGYGSLLDCNIRSLRINNYKRFGKEILINRKEYTEYGYVGYSTFIGKNVFGDQVDSNPSNPYHSPIIGWSYDGCPIYGPFGYSNPEDENSIVKKLETGYSLQSSLVFNRPNAFDSGMFVEDYVFTDSGDLDENNGRFCKTPEFPKGTYAYFAGITTSTSSELYEPKFPYFIGNKYNYQPLIENIDSKIDHSFDFNNSTLIRNTLPYKVNDEYAGSDFIIEPNETSNQISIIEDTSKGFVDSFDIIQSGEGYRINDTLEFNNEGTNGGGLSAYVSSIEGKKINNVETSIEYYPDTIFTWKNDNTVIVKTNKSHSLLENDTVKISGINSERLNNLLGGNNRVFVTQETTTLLSNVPTNPILLDNNAIDIYVSKIPSTISVGDSVGIGTITEIVSVLNVFRDQNVLRVNRGSVIGTPHNIGDPVILLPSKFEIKKNSEKFESRLNDVIHFNPVESIGVGTTPGTSSSANFTIGLSSQIISIPTQSIYLPNHPFEHAQKVILRKPPEGTQILVSNSPDQGSFIIPRTENSEIVYIIKKSKDYIGITTSVGLTTSTKGLFFISNAENNYEYSIESDFPQVKGDLEKIITKITLDENHNLLKGDLINLEVKSNESVGIGTSSYINLKYNSVYDRIIANPIGFTSSAINVLTNTISIPNHKFDTGDKVFYYADKVASGLSTGDYYVVKQNNTTIQLTETYSDSILLPPKTISLVSIGGSDHNLGFINPEIKITKNNDLVFSLKDPSLLNYKLKLFYDSTFTEEFVSDSSGTIFNISGIGTAGIGSESSLVLKYSDYLPKTLHYTLQKNGEIILPDEDVKNYSLISFKDSEYNGKYTIFDTSNNSFNITLRNYPEAYYYSKDNTDILKYSTKSTNDTGGVNRIRINFGGANYKKLPSFVKINSDFGINANIVPKSSTIGKINSVRILSPGFEYSSDNTLRPESYISPILRITNSNTIENIDVLDGGKSYISAPRLVLVNPVTNKVEKNATFEAKMSSGSIKSVQIIENPKGLSSVEHKLFATNNSNGIVINEIYSSPAGIITCYLSTPILGFNQVPFKSGDQIFVEGVENITQGTGFNSNDYDYSLFTVTKYLNTNPAQLEYSISGLTTNAGIAKTFQDAYPMVINYNNYPKFKVVTKSSVFFNQEKLSVLSGDDYVLKDLFISESSAEYIKVYGSYKLKIGDVIKGKNSGVIATIDKIQENYGIFIIDYSLHKNYGWGNSIGFTNDDMQVMSNNDYYQNLSYTIRSPLEYEELINPVNSLLHTSGLKNFSDTQVENSIELRRAVTKPIETSNIIDLSSELRVDTIFDFDLTKDIFASETRSKYIVFNGKRLSDYIECRTNRVLSVDDISGAFRNKENIVQSNSTLLSYSDAQRYSKILVVIKEAKTQIVKVFEMVLLNDPKNIYLLEKTSLSNTDIDLGSITADVSDGLVTVDFYPTDPYTIDYDIKILKDRFNTLLGGYGKYSVGFVDLIGSNSVVGVGTTATIVQSTNSNLKSMFVVTQVIDNSTLKMNYFETYLTSNGNDTYTSEICFDTETSEFSTGNYIGSFSSGISTNGILSLQFTNNKSNAVTIRSQIIGFGSTSSGIGTFRFLTFGQDPGSERTAKLESNYSKTSGISNILSFNSLDVNVVKSYIKVSVGSTSALHQVLMIQDLNDVYTSQYPFLSIESQTGIGTFGGEFDGLESSIKFYPDSEYFSDEIEIQSFSEIFYTDIDYSNIPDTLTYGTANKDYSISEYNAISGDRLGRNSFEMRYNNVPIFSKSFNPKNPNSLDPSTGTFTINNHFFSDNEELIYIADSTFVGIEPAPLRIVEMMDYTGILTTILPPKVFVRRLNKDQFKLATRRNVGGTVTFTDLGSGNAHRLEMAKKKEKTIITLNGVIQSPLTNTNITHELSNNGGSIDSISPFITLSGIGSIAPKDVLKVNDEYMSVINVGLGTTNVGPVTNIGDYPIVEVDRGFFGSISTDHIDSSLVEVFGGSYDIVENKIYFVDEPRGSGLGVTVDPKTNLLRPVTSFGGRVYLRSDYTTNKIYDDISKQFTGIGQTYTLTSNGINTSGIEPGSGLLIINGIFQTPTTDNNVGNNYIFEESASAGISSVTFTGISSDNGFIITTEKDVNQNQLPRGGLIVSLGSTPGLGYAPLVGASVTAVIGAGGSIVSVGLGITDNLGSAYRGTVSIGITDPNHTGTAASITATAGIGGTLAFTIHNGGSGYSSDVRIFAPSPSYENLPVTGAYRAGIGSTTETGIGLLLTLDVEPVSNSPSSFYEVSSFKISRPGYSFQIGDVIRAVGLVTDKRLNAPINDFELTVLSTFTDSFSAWQFGELDFIDPIKDLQTGNRVRFPLVYNGELLSFEKNLNDEDSLLIDLNNVLLIFVNGVIQEPYKNYRFEGGTSVIFTDPPKREDNVSIFFYRGSRDIDSVLINVLETIKDGDTVQVSKNNRIQETVTQDPRKVASIFSSNIIETNLYIDQGIDEENPKPLSWSKQKADLTIGGVDIYKSRDTIEPLVFPSAKVIKSVGKDDIQLFVDNIRFFNYEENESNIVISDFDAILVQDTNPVAAGITAVVSAAGTIQQLIINDGGNGYSGISTEIYIAAPSSLMISNQYGNIGIGSTATAIASVSNGKISYPITILDPGIGYTYTNPPIVIAPKPKLNIEKIRNIPRFQGTTGIITGITTTTGTNGNPLALKFFTRAFSYQGLNVTYPICVYDTHVGNGVVSINSNISDIIGYGSTFLDNIYYLNSLNVNGEYAEFIVNIHPSTPVVGLTTFGTQINPCGKFSWGRIFDFDRSEIGNRFEVDLKGYRVDAGLSTFPDIQRRGFGLRSTGSLRKDLG
jgi:hypothetical protein